MQCVSAQKKECQALTAAKRVNEFRRANSKAKHPKYHLQKLLSKEFLPILHPDIQARLHGGLLVRDAVVIVNVPERAQREPREER